MGLVSPAQVSDATTADASDINNPINTIANEFNGNIDNSNIKTAAAIDASKLAAGSVTSTQLATAVSPVTRQSDTGIDYVGSGCVWSGDAYGSTLNASMTAGVVYISGVRLPVTLVTAKAFTASKDTYVDVDSTGTVTYNPQSNNAASPALAAGSIRIAIIVTGATNIAAVGSINQGSGRATLPVVSSQILAMCDTNGVQIYNTNPVQVTIIRGGTSSPAPTSATDVAGATTTFTLTKPSKVSIDLYAHVQLNSGGTRIAYWSLLIDGTGATGTFVEDNPGAAETHLDVYKPYDTMLYTGSHTIKIQASANSAGVTAMDGGFRLRIG